MSGMAQRDWEGDISDFVLQYFLQFGHFCNTNEIALGLDCSPSTIRKYCSNSGGMVPGTTFEWDWQDRGGFTGGVTKTGTFGPTRELLRTTINNLVSSTAASVAADRR